MFQNLDSHSVLHVLHRSTNLSQLPENEVLQMLHTRPVFSSAQQSPLAMGIHWEISSNSEAEILRDSAVYHGFCALRGFLEIILATHGAKSEIDVTTKINESCNHVNAIYPITFRVEVLENVFSLLFVSSEHLLEEFSAAYETDDLETLDSRSLRSSRTASFESFLSHDSRNTSPWKSFRSQEQSASRPISPELSNTLDVEQSKPPPPDTFPRISTEISSLQKSDLLKVEAVSPPESILKKPVIAQELTYVDANVEEGEFNEEVFPLLQLGSSKEKLLDSDERSMKGLLMNREMVRQFLEALKECLNEVIRLKTESSEHSKSKCLFHNGS